MGEQYPALPYSDNMWEDSKNGILTVECNSWEEFNERIGEYKNYKYFWRGQSCEKSLLPTIFRGHNPGDNSIKEHLNHFIKDMPGAGALEGFLKERTSEFDRALTKYREITLQGNDDKDLTEKNFIDDIYWAIGQHHGLKTPFLDWTGDPYKALFFAFCERKETNDKRVVFGLAEKSRRLVAKGKQTRRYIEFLDNLDFVKIALCSSKFPTDVKERIGQMFSRIQEQNGLFTRTLSQKDIGEYAKQLYNKFKNSSGEEKVFLIKILIPNSVRKDLLEKLEEMGITYKTMYPDLQGAALHCNLKLYP